MKKNTLILSLLAVMALTASVSLNISLYRQLKTEQARKAESTEKNKGKNARTSLRKKKTSDFFLKSAESTSWAPRTVRLQFSCDSPVPVPATQGFLTVTPAVPFRVETEYASWKIKGGFEPDKVYEFTL